MSAETKVAWTDEEKQIIKNAIDALKAVRFMQPDRRPYAYNMDSVLLDLEEAHFIGGRR
jgi:hypothetical protein